MQTIQRYLNASARRALVTKVVCGVVAAVVLVAGPYFMFNPGATFGRARFIPVAELAGEADPNAGQYVFLSYTKTDASFTEWVSNPFEKAHRAPRRAQDYVYGDLREEEATASALGADLDIFQAQDQAWSAANRLIGREVEGEPLLIVDYVRAGSPAEAAGLDKGDRILTINDGEVKTNTVGLNKVVETGEPITFEVARNGSTRMVTVTPVPETYERTAATFTIGLETSPGVRVTGDRPFMPIPEGTTGPSGGVVYALAYLDAVTDGDLTGGMLVAGTGTIEPTGSVGRIGGVREKVAAAVATDVDVLFIAHENYDEAMEHAPADLKVVPVVSLSVAVRWLCENGGTSTACANVFFHGEVSGLPEGFDPTASTTPVKTPSSSPRGNPPL